MPYPEALALQHDLVQQRQRNAIPDTLILLEHPPTITLGRGTHESDLLTPPSLLAQRHISVERVDRGGEITYHGPGQLVGYPIFDLRQHGQDLHRYLRDLEEVLIQTLETFGLIANREPGLTGVWADGKKIAAIGIKVSRWVSQHGFALNISTDLRPFRQDFIPCGIHDRDVTSIAELLGKQAPSRVEVEAEIVQGFHHVFALEPQSGWVSSK